MTADIMSRISPLIGGRRRIALLTAGTLAAGGLATVGLAALQPGTAEASSHREAPLISGQPQFDNTDLYAFTSPDKASTTTIVANWIPFEDPAGGPNFYKFAEQGQYDIHIDNDGDAQDDYIYRWTFKDHVRNDNSFLYNTGVVTSLKDKDLNFFQTYNIDLLKLKKGYVEKTTRIARNLIVAPSNVGKASMPYYSTLRKQAIRGIGSGTKVFAGQADDPFFADLRVFDLLYGGDLSEVGDDTLAGYNVNTLAIQVPTKYIRESKKQPVIGIYSTTQRLNSSGRYVQVSRLGNPLVNEVVNPLKDKDKFNASSPYDDAQFLDNVTHPELPKLIEGIFKIKAPSEPRDDLVSVFLTGVKGLNQPPYVRPAEELRLNTSIKPAKNPKRLGVLDGDKAGFPNGRRLTDDVIDISLQAVEGELVGSPNDLGDAVDANDVSFEKHFPYVADPASGSDAASKNSTKSGTNVLNGGGIISGTDNTVMIASAASGVAGVLLIGGGLVWWRSRRPRARRALRY